MTDKEKVIKGLEICSEHGSWHGLDCEHNEAYKDCPYRGCETGCIVTIAKDAIALLKEQEEQIKNRDESLEKAREEIKWLRGMLKEQEARVMTLEEVKAFVWDYCYLEEERLPGKEYRMVCGDYALTCITWPCVASMSIQHGDESYGRKWRCWSSKPTDEQREAVKWE